MGALRDAVVDEAPRRFAVAPVVDDQDVINPEAHTVIGAVGETIRPAVEPLVVGKAGREVIHGEALTGAVVAPLEVQARLIAADRRSARERRVVEVLGMPLTGGADRWHTTRQHQNGHNRDNQVRIP